MQDIKQYIRMTKKFEENNIDFFRRPMSTLALNQNVTKRT